MFRSACSALLCAVILSACGNAAPPAPDSTTASESAPTTPSPKNLPDPWKARIAQINQMG
jgi:hypothetical protein